MDEHAGPGGGRRGRRTEPLASEPRRQAGRAVRTGCGPELGAIGSAGRGRGHAATSRASGRERTTWSPPDDVADLADRGRVLAPGSTTCGVEGRTPARSAHRRSAGATGAPTCEQAGDVPSPAQGLGRDVAAPRAGRGGAEHTRARQARPGPAAGRPPRPAAALALGTRPAGARPPPRRAISRSRQPAGAPGLPAGGNHLERPTLGVSAQAAARAGDRLHRPA